MRWSVAEAKQKLSQVLRSAAKRPQRIYKRKKLVAVVVPPESFEEFAAWRAGKGQSIADAFAELRGIANQEAFELKLPRRRDRANALLRTRR